MVIKYIVPTLERSTILDNPSDIIDYILVKYLTFAKSATNTHYYLTISIADTISKYSNSPETIESTIKSELTNCFNTIFNNTMDVEVVVSTEELLVKKYVDANVSISVVITDADGVKYIIKKPFYINSNYEIKIGINDDYENNENLDY